MWVGRVTPATVVLLAGLRQSQWASGGASDAVPELRLHHHHYHTHTHTDKKNSLHTEKVSLHVVIIPILPAQFLLDKSALYACAETFFAGVQVWPWSFTKQTCPSTLNLSSARPRTDEMWDKKTYSQTFLDASLSVFARRLRVHIAINPHSIDLLRQETELPAEAPEIRYLKWTSEWRQPDGNTSRPQTRLEHVVDE